MLGRWKSEWELGETAWTEAVDRWREEAGRFKSRWTPPRQRPIPRERLNPLQPVLACQWVYKGIPKALVAGARWGRAKPRDMDEKAQGQECWAADVRVPYEGPGWWNIIIAIAVQRKARDIYWALPEAPWRETGELLPQGILSSDIADYLEVIRCHTGAKSHIAIALFHSHSVQPIRSQRVPAPLDFTQKRPKNPDNCQQTQPNAIRLNKEDALLANLGTPERRQPYARGPTWICRFSQVTIRGILEYVETLAAIA